MVGMTGNEYLKRYAELQKKSWSGVRTSKPKERQNTVECGIITPKYSCAAHICRCLWQLNLIDTITKRRY